MAFEAGSGPTDLNAEATIHDADTRRDVFYVVRQWNHYFGTEYRDDWLPYPLCNALDWAGEGEGPLDYCVLVAEIDEVLVGAGVAVLDDHDATVGWLPEGRFDADALAGDRNALLLFSAVDPTYRGRGIGRRLFEQRLTWARAVGAEMVFAYGWERRDARTSRPLFEANGFVPIQRFEAFYGTDDAERDACPDCGAWPSNDVECQCDMTLWALDVDSGGESA